NAVHRIRCACGRPEEEETMKHRRTPRRAAAVLALAAGGIFGPLTVRGTDTWDNSSGNSFWSTPTNWADDTEPTDTDAVIFPDPIPPPFGPITLGANENALSLTFNTSYTLMSGNLNFGSTGIGSVTVASSTTDTINSALGGTGTGLTKSGDGTLILGGVNTFTGNVAVNAGTLSINSDARLGNAS